MNKILLGTSALAMAGTIAGNAEAATWDLSWGGFYNSAVIYRDSDNLSSDQDGVDVVQDGEIQFTPSIVLDNGIQFGVVVEIEADPTAGQTIDDSHVFVEGPFGRLNIGSEAGAADAMAYGAPNVGWFGAGDVADYLAINALNFGSGPAFAGAANRITYYTPRLAGFQVGASYAHDDSQNKNSPTAGSNYDIFDIGANYENTFGALALAVSAVYSQASGGSTAGTAGTFVTVAPGTGAITATQFNSGAAIPAGSFVTTPATAAANLGDSDMYGFGMTIGYSGFVFGGNYTEQDIAGEADEREHYSLGVAYSTGPWGVSTQWRHAEQGNQDEDHIQAAATYKLGPGVVAGVYAGVSNADYNAAGSDPDGFLIGTGFALAF